MTTESRIDVKTYSPCGTKVTAVYDPGCNCLALAYKQNRVIITALNCKKDRLVVYLQNIITLMLRIIFRSKISITFRNTPCCVLITLNCSGSGFIWQICYINPSLKTHSDGMPCIKDVPDLFTEARFTTSNPTRVEVKFKRKSLHLCTTGFLIYHNFSGIIFCHAFPGFTQYYNNLFPSTFLLMPQPPRVHQICISFTYNEPRLVSLLLAVNERCGLHLH